MQHHSLQEEEGEESMGNQPAAIPVKAFDQARSSAQGNLSPLRSSSKWDAVHNDAMQSYAVRASQPPTTLADGGGISREALELR